MKFAFLIMGTDFCKETDRASIHGGEVQLIGVSSVDDACEVANELMRQGVSCIELCGAFGEDGAKKVIAATQNQLPIGYVTHLQEQNELFKQVFGE